MLYKYNSGASRIRYVMKSVLDLHEWGHSGELLTLFVYVSLTCDNLRLQRTGDTWIVFTYPLCPGGLHYKKASLFTSDSEQPLGSPHLQNRVALTFYVNEPPTRQHGLSPWSARQTQKKPEAGVPAMSLWAQFGLQMHFVAQVCFYGWKPKYCHWLWMSHSLTVWSFAVANNIKKEWKPGLFYKTIVVAVEGKVGVSYCIEVLQLFGLVDLVSCGFPSVQIWTEQSYSAESRQSPFFFGKQTKKLVSVGTWAISLRINKYKGLYSSDVGIRLWMMCCMTTQTHWFWMRTEKMEYSFVGCLHFLPSAFLSRATNEFLLVGTIKSKLNVHMQSVGRCLEHPCSHVRNLSHGLLEGTLMEVVEGSASITHLLSPFSQQVCGLKPLTFWSQVLHV